MLGSVLNAIENESVISGLRNLSETLRRYIDWSTTQQLRYANSVHGVYSDA